MIEELWTLQSILPYALEATVVFEPGNAGSLLLVITWPTARLMAYSIFDVDCLRALLYWQSPRAKIISVQVIQRLSSSSNTSRALKEKARI